MLGEMCDHLSEPLHCAWLGACGWIGDDGSIWYSESAGGCVEVERVARLDLERNAGSSEALRLVPCFERAADKRRKLAADGEGAGDRDAVCEPLIESDEDRG